MPLSELRPLNQMVQSGDSENTVKLSLRDEPACKYLNKAPVG